MQYRWPIGDMKSAVRRSSLRFQPEQYAIMDTHIRTFGVSTSNRIRTLSTYLKSLLLNALRHDMKLPNNTIHWNVQTSPKKKVIYSSLDWLGGRRAGPSRSISCAAIVVKYEANTNPIKAELNLTHIFLDVNTDWFSWSVAVSRKTNFNPRETVKLSP